MSYVTLLDVHEGAPPIMQHLTTHAIRFPVRILVVDDDDISRTLTFLFLRRMGYKADLAPTGWQALMAVREQCYDVIFMDLLMPEMDGLEVTQEIRALMSADQQPWIYALTVHDTADDIAAIHAAGIDGLIAKPLCKTDIDALLSPVAVQRVSVP